MRAAEESLRLSLAYASSRLCCRRTPGYRPGLRAVAVFDGCVFRSAKPILRRFAQTEEKNQRDNKYESKSDETQRFPQMRAAR